MKKIIFLLLLGAASLAQAYDYKYDEPVGLTGTLKTMPGNWPALILDKPITVVPPTGRDEDGLDTPESGVRVLHLVLSDQEEWGHYRRFKDRPHMRVMCKLFHAHTGYHKTPVLCDVQEITDGVTLP